MRKSICINGFWFHIDFEGNEGFDQRGQKWINPEKPTPVNEGIYDTCIDAYIQLIEKVKRGGLRPNSGAKPKYNEPTKTIAFRVPISKIEEIKSIVKCRLTEYKK